MALRLSTSTFTQGPPSASELEAQAARLLATGDTAAYRKLFDRAGEHEDPHRRYHAHVLLLERGLDAASRASANRAAEIFMAVGQSAIELLEGEPREPRVLTYAGVALYELWSLDGAQALFSAALRLDPSIPFVRRNLAEIKRRKKLARGPQPQIRPIQAALAALARRAKRVGARAQPAIGQTLSLCMIVRDEEEMLPRCLAAVKDAVDEIIIVDTGSTDRTIEIARSFGATVIEREWTGSFSDARNVSFDAASSDWVMYLDADEVVVREDAEKLRALTGRVWREAFYLTETNYTGEQGDGTALTHNALRIFRNRPEYRFDGRLHEQIAQKLPGYLPERIESTTLRIEHFGYLGSVRSSKEKSQRNIELLRAQMAESAPTPFLYFNLGSEYAAAEDSPAALTEFERAWEMIQNDREGTVYVFAPILVVRLVKALCLCGRASAAIDQAAEGLRLFPGFTDLVFEQGVASMALGHEADAVEYFEQCIEMGDAPARYTAVVGCGTYLPRLSLANIHLRRGETAAARELLDWCLAEHPGFFGTVLPYASVLLRSGVDPDDVAGELEQRVAETTPTVRFMLGTALYEAAAASAAERQFRLVLERQPHSAQARIALGEALLSQRHYVEAAAEVSELPLDDPLAAVAARTELFGRIAGGDFEGARTTLERAVQAKLPADELALFEGWAELGAGNGLTKAIPLTAVPLLGVVLEALLRVQDFSAFEKLLPMLAQSGLPPREQRELLGSIYLRRGFLASAAEEWMAVCEQGPDARALVGLAQVAAAHGLPADAANFASEALALDRGNLVAEALLSRYQTAQAA
jgi:glycosyltransferase involved in cell wall biosynthesis